MSEERLEIGDTVRIKSGGGYLMTILEIRDDEARVRYDKKINRYGDIDTVDEWLPIAALVFDDGTPPGIMIG